MTRLKEQLDNQKPARELLNAQGVQTTEDEIQRTVGELESFVKFLRIDKLVGTMAQTGSDKQTAEEMKQIVNQIKEINAQIRSRIEEVVDSN